MNIKKKVVMAALLAAILWAVPLTAYAADAKVLETKVYGEDIYIFIKGILEIASGSTVQIGNKACLPEQISAVPFEKMDVYMNTIILIDNSQSIPVKNHGDIAGILNAYISGAGENERIRIGTFSEEVAYLCDYTNDHNVLQDVVGNITYSDQSTYLSDVLYGVVSQIKEEENSVCTRVIIFSDGADDKFIGYTNDEVRGYIEKNQCPVYTVGMANNNAQALETMFSFSRAAKTEYFLLDGTVPNEDIANAFLSDRNGICVKISPEESLKDGSTKSIRLRLNTAGGEIDLTTSADMPFGSGLGKADTEPESEIKTALPTITPAKSDDNADKKDGDGKTKPGSALWIIMAICGVAAVVTAVFFVKLKKQKQKSEPGPEPSPKPGPKPIQKLAPNDGDTILQDYPSDLDVKALWKRKKLMLKNLDVPRSVYEMPIKGTVSIGRLDSQDISINDEELSREHCIITLDGDSIFLENISKSNGTVYEGAKMGVNEKRQIANGGVIEIGKYKYRVEVRDE